jgi:hypothetical protein
VVGFDGCGGNVPNNISPHPNMPPISCAMQTGVGKRDKVFAAGWVFGVPCLCRYGYV